MSPRFVLLSLLAMWVWLCLIAPASADVPAEPVCKGALAQGGLAICHAPPGTRVSFGDGSVLAGEDGIATIGIRRSAPAEVVVKFENNGVLLREVNMAIDPREDPVRVLDGMDCDKVDARSEAQKAHAGRSWQKKVSAFATFTHDEGEVSGAGFIRPTTGLRSSPFGPVRTYRGVSSVTGTPCEKTSVHRGYDIAAPIGTPILSPAAGTVLLADGDLYYEGGAVFIDHGHGLVSVFMHMSEIDVTAGDRVGTGDRVGAVGNTGRTTGPHLHWGVKWRNAASEDRSSDIYIDPALLMEIAADDWTPLFAPAQASSLEAG